MTFLIVPAPDGRAWSEAYFPDVSPLHLGVVAKTWAEHLLDWCQTQGAAAVKVLDAFYDEALARKHLADGARWGLRLAYEGAGPLASEADAIARNRGFAAGDADVRVVWGLVFPYRGALVKVDSLAAWFDLNFKVLEDPAGRTLPGYSAEPGVSIGENVAIMTRAHVDRPVALGDNVRIADGASLAGGVIVGDGSYVEKDCSLRRSIVFSHTYLGHGLSFVDKVVAGARVVDAKTGAFVDLDESGLSARFHKAARIRPVDVWEWTLAVALAVGLLPLVGLLWHVRRSTWAYKLSVTRYSAVLRAACLRGRLVRRPGARGRGAFCASEVLSERRTPEEQRLDDVWYQCSRTVRFATAVVAKGLLNRLIAPAGTARTRAAEDVRPYQENGPTRAAEDVRPYQENGPTRAAEDVRPYQENGPTRAAEDVRPYQENGPTRADEDVRPYQENGPTRAAGFTAVGDGEADALVRGALPEVAAAVRACGLPGYAALLLGGGYGRGEGGVAPGHRLANDLDFFVLLDAPERTFPSLAAKLKPVAEAFTARLGVDVDFTLRTAARLKHDARRIMVQELLRGHVVVDARAPGFDLAAWSGARERPAAAVPPGEAARLLMNRGMGLDLARRRLAANGGVADAFVLRNLNKAVLGAGDARLVAEGRYAWRLDDREAALGDAAYSRACAFKRRPAEGAALPSAALPLAWEAAFAAWREAADALFARRGGELRRRSVRQLMRWLVRRRTVGPLSTLGMDCTVRVLERIRATLADGVPPSVARDWEVFN